MATLGANVRTLADWAKQVDPDGKTATVVELLAQTNDILKDAHYEEGNLPTGHRLTVRTGLPTVAWRRLNSGVAPSKSTTAQIDEQCGMLEGWSEVDKDLAELNGNTAEFRLSEARSFFESLSQEMTQTLFYGNVGLDPEEFMGLAPRYSALTGAGNSQNVLSGGGSGSDNSSIWLVVWGANTLYNIFPKGSMAGIFHEDLGLQTIEVTAGIAGNRMRAYQDHWQWKTGLALKDWRYAVRIANIDISNLVAESSAANLVKNMIKAMHRIPMLRAGKPAFYMNRTCFQMLDIQRFNNVAGAGLTYADVDGRLTPMFREVPIRICDALTETEATVA